MTEFKREAWNNGLRIGGGSDLPIAAVAQHELILGVIEGEAFGDALDGFDQALPRQGDFAKIVRLDLDRRVAEHHQRAGHLGDLVAASRFGKRHAQVAAGHASMLLLRALSRATRLRST